MTPEISFQKISTELTRTNDTSGEEILSPLPHIDSGVSIKEKKIEGDPKNANLLIESLSQVNIFKLEEEASKLANQNEQDSQTKKYDYASTLLENKVIPPVSTPDFEETLWKSGLEIKR